mgnify:CR=1 FL=1
MAGRLCFIKRYDRIGLNQIPDAEGRASMEVRSLDKETYS